MTGTTGRNGDALQVLDIAMMLLLPTQLLAQMQTMTQRTCNAVIHYATMQLEFMTQQEQVQKLYAQMD